MHAIAASDPLVWLLLSYLSGTFVCGVWALTMRLARWVAPLSRDAST